MNNIDRSRLSNKMMNKIYVSQMACSDIISIHHKLLDLGWWHLSECKDRFTYINRNTKYDVIDVTSVNTNYPYTYKVSVPTKDDLYVKHIIGADKVYLYICEFLESYTPYS